MPSFVIVFSLARFEFIYAFRFCYCIINAVFRTKDCLFAEFTAFKAVLSVFDFASAYCDENCTNGNRA